MPSLFFSDPHLSSYSQHSHWSLHTVLQYQAAIVTDAFCSFSLAQKEIASSICVTLAELAVVLDAQIPHGLSMMPFSKVLLESLGTSVGVVFTNFSFIVIFRHKAYTTNKG